MPLALGGHLARSRYPFRRSRLKFSYLLNHCYLKADGHLQGLYSHILLLHAFPRITESLKTKYTLDQKLLVIVHHRFGWNFHLRLWRITDIRNHKPEIVNSNWGVSTGLPAISCMMELCINIVIGICSQ